MKHLSYAQIDYLIDNLPKIPGANELSRDVATQDIKNNLKLYLSTFKFVDDTDAIDELKTYIFHTYMKSWVCPGTPAGIRTAEGLGADITQATLNSFHYSGTEKGAQTGISGIAETLNATKNDKKNQYTSAHFVNEYLSFSEILNMKKIFVEATVNGLLSKTRSEILTFDEATSQENETAYNFYYSVVKAPKLRGKYYPLCLRIYLDVDKLYQFKITTFDVASLLSYDQGDMIVCVPHPTITGVVDIYPVKKKVVEMYLNQAGENVVLNSTETIKIYIKNVLIPAFKVLLLKGMRGNKDIRPVKVKISEVIRSYLPYSYPDDQDFDTANLYKIMFYPAKMRKYGISRTRLRNFILASGAEILYFNEMIETGDEVIKFQVSAMPFPDEVIVIRTTTPDLNNMEKIVEDTNPRELNYYYAKVMGTNYVDVVAHPLINSQKSISNDPYQMSKYLGISGARTVLTEEYQEMFSDNYINPRNIANIVNFQTSQGVFLPVTSRGVSRQPIGPMTKASFQEATKYLAQGAAFGAYESTNSVSASVYLGKRIKLGTGCMEIEYSEDIVPGERYPQIFNKTVKKGVIVTEDSEETLDLGDEVRDSGNFNMPPNYPPPRVIPCYRDLPPMFAHLAPVDTDAKIRNILNTLPTDFSIQSFLDSAI